MKRKRHIKKHLRLVKFNFTFVMFSFFALMTYIGYAINVNPIFSGNNILRLASSYQLKHEVAKMRVSAQSKEERANSIPVLVYHGFTKTKHEDDYNISVDRFKEHCFELKKAGYTTITLKQFQDFVDKGTPVPEKSVLLTFDDGRKDSYYKADPILESVGFNAVMFDITSELNQRKSTYYLTQSEFKEMIKTNRWEVGAHAYEGHGDVVINDKGDKGHFFSNKEWLSDKNRLETDEEYEQRIKDDLTHAKNDLENSLNIKVTAFAYPYGDYGQESINYPEAKNVLVKTVHDLYSTSFYLYWDEYENFNYANEPNNFIKRISTTSAMSGNDLVKILDARQAKTIPFEFKNLEKTQGWTFGWGKIDFAEGKMKLAPDDNSKGASVILDGTKYFHNYSFESNVSWQAGSNIGLIAAYSDNNNYIAFDLSDSAIRLQQKQNGQLKIIKEVRREFDFPKDNFNLGIKIDGDDVSLSINQKVFLECSDIKSLPSGSIGYKVWDDNSSNASLTVNSLGINNDWGSSVLVVDPKSIKSLPLSETDFNQDIGWTKTWGILRYDKKAMILESKPDSTGAAAYLEGSNNWQNYSYQTVLDWSKGSNVILMGRYIDEKNYVSVNISDQFVRIEQKIDDKTQVLSEVKNEFSLPKYGMDVKMELKGNKVAFFVKDVQKFEFTGIDSKFTTGGIGLKIWDQNPNNAKIIVNKISIDPL